MSRAERLLSLMQVLRRHRHPVTGAALADELSVSLRTLYRDIASLQAQGATIDGAPGLGYVLRPGYLLPPLMFSDDEIAALALGTRWVADRADARLADAARNALAKIGAVLPDEARHELATTALLVGPGPSVATGTVDVSVVRRAIRGERKLSLAYLDPAGRETTRVIWPFALGFFDRAQVVVAYCELREATRHFRADRIVSITPTDARYPRRRLDLLRAWRAEQSIPPAADGN